MSATRATRADAICATLLFARGLSSIARNSLRRFMPSPGLAGPGERRSGLTAYANAAHRLLRLGVPNLLSNLVRGPGVRCRDFGIARLRLLGGGCLPSALSGSRRSTRRRSCPSLLDLGCRGSASGRALNRTAASWRRRNWLTRDTRHRLGRTRRRNGARSRDLGGRTSWVDCARVPYVGSPCSGIDRARVSNGRGRGARIHAQRLGSCVMA